MTNETSKEKRKKPLHWLIYISLFLSGIIFLGEATGMIVLQKWSARLSIVLLFSAFALLIGNGRRSGFIATAIVWATVIVVYFL